MTVGEPGHVDEIRLRGGDIEPERFQRYGQLFSFSTDRRDRSEHRVGVLQRHQCGRLSCRGQMIGQADQSQGIDDPGRRHGIAEPQRREAERFTECPGHDEVAVLEHYHVAYVTNDMDRALGVFRDRFGVTAFRTNDNAMDNGSRISVRAAWIGGMMYEICLGEGPGMELYTEWAEPGGEFVLRLHHFGYLVSDDEAWDALEGKLDRGGWTVRSRSDIPGFVRACFVDVRELGHLLEFVQPRAGLLEKMNATPVS